MDPIYEIDLDVCPHCGGVGAIQDEQGWCVYVDCLDCGSHTVHAAYETPEERLAAARQVAHLWNIGKVIHAGVATEPRPSPHKDLVRHLRDRGDAAAFSVERPATRAGKFRDAAQLRLVQRCGRPCRFGAASTPRSRRKCRPRPWCP